jgi:hypothetical protein
MKVIIGGTTGMQGVGSFTPITPPPNEEIAQMTLVAVFVPETQAEKDAVGSDSVVSIVNGQFHGTEDAVQARGIISRAARDYVLAAWSITLLANDIVLPSFQKGGY